MVAILNTSILTSFGTFDYSPLTLDEARGLVQEGLVSHVGHQSTAEILTELLGFKVEMNRTPYTQETGNDAIVFKLNGRAPEGKILSKEEIEGIGYSFGLLYKIP